MKHLGRREYITYNESMSMLWMYTSLLGAISIFTHIILRWVELWSFLLSLFLSFVFEWLNTCFVIVISFHSNILQMPFLYPISCERETNKNTTFDTMVIFCLRQIQHWCRKCYTLSYVRLTSLFPLGDCCRTSCMLPCILTKVHLSGRSMPVLMPVHRRMSPNLASGRNKFENEGIDWGKTRSKPIGPWTLTLTEKSYLVVVSCVALQLYT